MRNLTTTTSTNQMVLVEFFFSPKRKKNCGKIHFYFRFGPKSHSCINKKKIHTHSISAAACYFKYLIFFFFVRWFVCSEKMRSVADCFCYFLLFLLFNNTNNFFFVSQLFDLHSCTTCIFNQINCRF